MNTSDSRREFLKKSALLGTGLSLAGSTSFQTFAEVAMSKNKLPAWKGFNLLDFFSMIRTQADPPNRNISSG